MTRVNTSRRHTFIWALSALVVLAIAWALYAHWPGLAHKDRPMGMGGRAEPVAAVAVVPQDVPVYIDALGTVTPTQSVTVITQVDGILASGRNGPVDAGDAADEQWPEQYGQRLAGR